MAKEFKSFLIAHGGSSIHVPAFDADHAARKAVKLFDAEFYSKGADGHYYLSIEGVWTQLHVMEF